MNNSSKITRIFGGQKGGVDIYQNQGRNVPPFASQKKISQQSSQKYIQSPFEGYVSAQSNLAYSQVSDLNFQLTRKFIKQQLAKFGGFDQSKIRNDVDIMKTEIRTLKQHVVLMGLSKSQSVSIKNEQQLKQKVLKIFEQRIGVYHRQTSLNLREVIRKFDESVKKDCDKRYLPVGFVNDVETQFLKLEDRIQLLQSKIDGNKKQRSTEDSIVLAEAFQLRLKKVQRQFEQYKKTIGQIQDNLNSITEANSSLKSKQNEDEQRLRMKIQQVKNSLLQNQKQIKTYNTSIDQISKQQKQISRKLRSIEQNQNKSPPKWGPKNSNQSSDVKEFLNSSKGLATSTVYQGFNGTNQLFKVPYNDRPSQQEKKQSSQSTDELFYRIDKQNYLLDNNNNYILDQQGRQIQLSEEQLSFLRQSKLVKLCE